MMKLIFDPRNYIFNITALVYFISGTLIAAESIFILLQNRKSLVNFSFFLCNIIAGIWLTGVGFIYSSGNEATAMFWSRYYSWFGIIFVTPAVYLLSESWRGVISKNKRLFIGFNFLTALIIYLICISTPFIVSGLWPYPWGLYPKAGILQIPFMVWFYALMVLSFRNFILRFKQDNVPIRKQHTKLVIITFVFGFLGSLDYIPNFGIPLYTFASISVLLFSTTLAYSIIRYKLMEIETVIHKTIAWVLTSIALIIPFAGFIYFARNWFVTLNTLNSVISLWSVLLVFMLFVINFQPKVDHFFQRRRYGLEEISNSFAEELIHLRGFNDLIAHLEVIIAKSLYTQNVDIYIYSEKKGVFLLANIKNNPAGLSELAINQQLLFWLRNNTKIIHREFVDTDPVCLSVKEELKDYFNLTDAVMLIPLSLNERLVGIINLSKKANLKRYNAADLHFLNILKNQSTIAISNSLLYQDIEEQVKQRTSELVETQKQLIHAEKLATVGTLAGGVAHEINNPLTAILTNVQMLLSENIINGDSKDSLQLIEEATRRCRTIVQGLMTYAKKPLENSEVSKVNLFNVINKVTSFLGYQMEQENIKIVIEAQEGDYFVSGNHNEFEQVVTNMVLNAKDAIKHIRNSGMIQISLVNDGKWIKMIIKDDGVGMPKEIISKIFDPFFTTKEVGKGTGLGLSICQSIVEKHKGVITVQSEVNKGTAFTVKLPKVQAA